MATLERAIKIATEAHDGQYDKGGRPYIYHPFRVMKKCESTEEKIVAVLHDVVEDTEWTVEMLDKEGFSKDIIYAITCITRMKDEDYESFISRVKTNTLATHVKINDLIDNVDITRLDKITEKDVARVRKYVKAYNKLSAVGNTKIIAASIVVDLWEIILLFPKKRSLLINVDLNDLINKACPMIEELTKKIEMTLNSSILDDSEDLKNIVNDILVLLKDLYCYIKEHLGKDNKEIYEMIFVIIEDVCISFIQYYTQEFEEAFPN